MLVQTISRLSAVAFLAAFATAPMTAGLITTSGTLSDPNQIVQEVFTLSTTANVIISTLLPANLATAENDTTGSFHAGGFDPVAWLFSDTNYNGSTTQLDKNDDICVGAGTAGAGFAGPSNTPDANCTGQVFDSQFSLTLNAGTYVAVISTSGQHFFKPPDFQVPGWSYGGTFDFGSNPVEVRTGFYQLTISSSLGNLTPVSNTVLLPNEGFVSATPEPATAVLILIGAVPLAWKLRRDRSLP